MTYSVVPFMHTSLKTREITSTYPGTLEQQTAIPVHEIDKVSEIHIKFY